MSPSPRHAVLRLLVRHELRSVLRDRKTVMLSVLLPILLMPLLLIATRWIGERREAQSEAQVHHYALVGEDREQRATQIERNLAQWPESAGAKPQLERETVEDPAAALAAGELSAYVTSEADPDGRERVEIHYQGNRESSTTGAGALRELLEREREQQRQALLEQRGVTLEIHEIARVETVDVAAKSESAGLTLGKFLTLTLLFLMLPGGQVVAADIMAGEKERGTLETLLTTAASRQDIVLSKLLTIATVAVAITAINVANLLVYVSFGLLPGAEAHAGSITPLCAGLIALLFIPVALLLSSLLLLLSAQAGSYKEAQLFMVPVQLLAVVPALAAMLPKLELRSAIALVPIANVSVASREILTGHFDWLMLALVVVANSGLAWWTARRVAHSLDEERLIAPTAGESLEAPGGDASFQRHVLRWFAAIWALLFVGASFVTDLRGQVALNLVVLMLGGSILMARHYKLDLRTAWALRKPPALAWLAVAIGAPAGVLVTFGVFELSGLVLPVPQEALERFAEGFSIDLPTWQLILIIAVLPGLCEEIFFRGMLLHGLRKRFSPVVLCLVVGLVFGLFHVALFRLVPTAFLGVLLAALTLLTGSVLPAMLWHMAHNTLSLLAGEAGFSPADASLGVYLGASVVLAIAFAILWRVRTPYPDLRGDSS